MFFTLLDIGGTNVRIAFKFYDNYNSKNYNNDVNNIFDYSFDYYFKEKIINIKDFYSFLEHHFFLFKKVLEEKNVNFNSIFDSVLLISFAGVVVNKEDFKLTNYDFVLKRSFLEKFKEYYIFNDLESVAFRIKRLNEKYNFVFFDDVKKTFSEDNTFIEIYTVENNKNNFEYDNFFIVKPGTGLGSSLIFKNNIIPLELASVPYSIFFEEDKDFYEYLKLKLKKDFVTFENFISSKSLEYYYEFNNNDFLDSKSITFEYENDVKKKEVINFFVRRLLFFSFVFSKSLNSNNIVLSGNIVKSIVKEFFKPHILEFIFDLQKIFLQKNIFIILEKDQNLKGLLDFYFFYRGKN